MKRKTLFIITILVLVIISAGFLAYQMKSKKPQQSNQEITRQRDIAEIKKFSGNQDLDVQFESKSKSSYNDNVTVGIYTAGSSQYEVDSRNGKIIQFGSSPNVSAIGDGTARPSEEFKMFSPEELEIKAREFIASRTNVQLNNLTPNHGNKDKNYFFRWEDRSQKTIEGYPVIQVGFSEKGVMLSYINTLGL